MSINSAPMKDKVAIITGATGDIGFAIARRFLQAGAKLALLDLDIDALRLRCTHDLSAADSSNLLCVACDVSDEHATKTCVDTVAEKLGGVHVLVNNAAPFTPTHKLADLPVAQWNLTLAVNATGAFLMSKWSIPHLCTSGGGVILNIASQMGHVTAPGRGAYGASKAALLSLTRSIAVDHAQDNIRCVSISPGAVMTGRLVRRYGSEDAASQALAPHYPATRIGLPDEVATAAVFLCGDGAAFVTGTDLLVDGGYTAV